MFKFGRKSLQILDPEPIMRSKSNSFSLVSPRDHHSISFTAQQGESQKPVLNTQSKFGRKTLPADFADTLLNLEIEVELNDNIQIDTFQQLITLYMDGVEYYESNKDRKYIYFQRKLNGLMTKPAFLMSTAKQSSPSKSDLEPQTSQQDVKKKEFLDQQKQLELNLIYGDSESKQAKVNEIVQLHCDQVKRIDVIIQNDINSQEDTIKERLEKRRKNGLSRVSSLPTITVEESVLLEALFLAQKSSNKLNPEDSDEQEKLSTSVKDENNQILPIQEEEDQELGRKESIIKYKKRKIQASINFNQDPKLIKRQSQYIGTNIINQLMRRQNTKKERAKSFPTKEYLKVIFREEYAHNVDQKCKETLNLDLVQACEEIAKQYQKKILFKQLQK